MPTATLLRQGNQKRRRDYFRDGVLYFGEFQFMYFKKQSKIEVVGQGLFPGMVSRLGMHIWKHLTSKLRTEKGLRPDLDCVMSIHKGVGPNG